MTGMHEIARCAHCSKAATFKTVIAKKGELKTRMFCADHQPRGF